MNQEVLKQVNETTENYIRRLCSNKKEYGLSWQKISDIVAQETGIVYSETFYRRNYKYCNCGVTEALSEKSELDSILQDIRKERTRLSDERTQNRAYLRRLDREETLKEIAHDYALNMSAKKFLPSNSSPCEVTILDEVAREGILLLSDWHYGMVCENPWNKFDPDVCKQRLRALLDKVIEIVEKDNIINVTVLNLSDLIAGRIHTQIRIESRFDVITQTMDVAEILAEFLSELSTYCHIDYYDCLDNHSRLEPNKNDSMDLESMVRMIPWYLKERLLRNNGIKIHDNEFGADIITCQVMGHDVIGVHGDHDRPATALDKLTLMTHRHYDLLCTAHLHHFNADEKNQSLIISNGSLMGVDSYAEKLRLTSDPSQTFITVSKDNVCECIYRIVLK